MILSNNDEKKRSKDMKEGLNLCVTSASGLEGITKRELKKFGIDAPADRGRLYFQGGNREIAVCNLHLRTAGHVMIVLGSFYAKTFDELFEGISGLAAEEFITPDGNIIVNAKSTESTLFSLSSIQSITKKAVCSRLMSKNRLTSLPESGALYRLEISIFKDKATLYLDTSGDALHKRGYRTYVGDAPLRETTAAALIELSVWNPSRPLADLFCGSGTIAIEAALTAFGIPPGLNRDFDFLHWKEYPKEVFDGIKAEAEEGINFDKEVSIQGYDIDENQVKLAQKHAKAAGVGEYIHFQRRDMREFSSKRARGVVITNPPYGERLLDQRDAGRLMKEYGRIARELPDWCFYTLTALDGFERFFEKKADRKRKIYNGKLECVYYTHLSGKKPVLLTKDSLE